MISFALSLASYLVPKALAAPCEFQFVGIPCESEPQYDGFIENTVLVLVEIVAGLSVLFVVIGGAFLVMNFGNDSQMEKGRKSIFFALCGFVMSLFSQAIISFVIARTDYIDPNYSSPPLELMRVIVASMLYIFNAVFGLMMIFYGYKLVLARGQQSELDIVKKGLMWTVAGAIAVNLAYALVNATFALIT